MATVVVVGGGISGLSAAYYLTRAAGNSILKKVVVLEGSSRVGGWVESTRSDDGTIYEHGPRSVRSYSKTAGNTLRLIEDLGLVDEMLPVTSAHAAAQNRYIYANKQLHALPKGLGGLVRISPPFTKSLFAQCWKEPFRPRSQNQDETIYDFFSRRFSPEVARYGADPLCRGIFAGDCRQLSVKACFPDLWNAEQTYGSVVKGMVRAPKAAPPQDSALIKRMREEKASLWSLRRGLQQLVDGLAERLTEDGRTEVHTDTRCDELAFTDDKGAVKTSNETIQADHVIASCYSKDLSSLLPSSHEELSSHLASIPAVSCGVVNLQFKGSNILPKQGFGHLVPSTEGTKVMGVIYDSCVFPEHDQKDTTKVTCMMGGAWFKELFGDASSVRPDDFIIPSIEAVREQLGITQEPSNVIAKLQKDCIPQYLLGHTDLVSSIESYITDNKLPLSVIGSSYKGPAINECINNARIDAENVMEKLK